MIDTEEGDQANQSHENDRQSKENKIVMTETTSFVEGDSNDYEYEENSSSSCKNLKVD